MDKDVATFALSRAHARARRSLDLIEAICERVANGGSLATICKETGMPSRKCVLEWVRQNPHYRAMYEMALMMRAEGYADELVTLADTAAHKSLEEVTAVKLLVNTRQWIVSRLLPKKYGSHQAIDDACAEALTKDQIEQRLMVLLNIG